MHFKNLDFFQKNKGKSVTMFLKNLILNNYLLWS